LVLLAFFSDIKKKGEERGEEEGKPGTKVGK